MASRFSTFTIARVTVHYVGRSGSDLRAAVGTRCVLQWPTAHAIDNNIARRHRAAQYEHARHCRQPPGLRIPSHVRPPFSSLDSSRFLHVRPIPAATAQQGMGEQHSCSMYALHPAHDAQSVQLPCPRMPAPWPAATDHHSRRCRCFHLHIRSQTIFSSGGARSKDQVIIMHLKERAQAERHPVFQRWIPVPNQHERCRRSMLIRVESDIHFQSEISQHAISLQKLLGRRLIYHRSLPA